MKLPIFTTIEEKRRAYDYEQVGSLDEALQVLKKWKKRDSDNVYFRGQAEGSWKIYASAQREWLDKELNVAYGCYHGFLSRLLSDFKENGSTFLKKYCKVVIDVSIFSTSQHYGAPTPFVDWTSSFDVALYFASLGNENCVGFETDSYCSVYCLAVGKGLKTPDNDLIRFSTLLENHKKEMQKVQREFGKIPGSDYQEALNFDVWKNFPVIWMEESENELMLISNPRLDLQGGAFVYNSDPEKSLDQIFTGRKMSDGDTDDLLLPKICCLDIHKSVLPQLQNYLKNKNIHFEILGLNSDDWGKTLYRQFRAHS